MDLTSLEGIQQLGAELAKTVDATIGEIEAAGAAETDVVYINLDKNPPEIRRVSG